GARPRDCGGAFFHRIVDVEQLQIEEHALAGRDQRVAEPEPVPAIEQLVPDLEEVDPVLDLFDQPLGLRAGVEIEGDDQRSSGLRGHGESPWLEASRSHMCAPAASGGAEIAVLALARSNSMRS